MEYKPTEDSIDWTRRQIEKLLSNAAENNSNLVVCDFQSAGIVMNLSFDKNGFFIRIKGNQSEEEASQMQRIVANFTYLGYKLEGMVRFPGTNSTSDIFEMDRNMQDLRKRDDSENLEELRKLNGWDFSPIPILNDLMTERALLLNAAKDNAVDGKIQESFLEEVRKVELKISKFMKEIND